MIEQQISMVTEDFGIYNGIASGFYAWVGVKKEHEYPHHHEKFDIDENAIPIIATLYVEFVLKYINSSFKN